jgi:uronate dehydrogenase
MKAKTVLITGSSGQIGRVLVGSLQDRYMIKTADLPEHDLRDWDTCTSVIANTDVVIHLAWNTLIDNWKSERIDPDNWRITENVFLAARACGVPRVVFASSVHVESYRTWNSLQDGQISPHRDCIPDSPYGAHKLGLEKLGRWNATQGLEVICVRFGGVSDQTAPWDDIPLVGLSHPDCARMISCCIDAQSVPDNFTVFYGISANKNRIHDYSNVLGWEPQDDAAVFYNCDPSKINIDFLGL